MVDFVREPTALSVLQGELAAFTSQVTSVSDELKVIRNFLILKFGAELESFLEESHLSLLQVEISPDAEGNRSGNDSSEHDHDDIQSELEESHKRTSEEDIHQKTRRSPRKRKRSSADAQTDNVKIKEEGCNKDNDSVTVETLLQVTQDDIDDQLEREASNESDDGSVGNEKQIREKRKLLEDISKEYVQKSSGILGLRKSYTLQFKKDVLKYRESHSGEETARVFKITASTLRGWRRHKAEIEAAVETSGNAGGIKKRLKGGGRKRVGQQSSNSNSTKRKGDDDEQQEVFFMSESNDDSDNERQEEELLEFNSLLNSS